MVFLWLIVLFPLVIFAIIEGSHFSVYGKFIKKGELDAYLNKYLGQATLNPYSDDRTLFADMPRYVARASSFLSKWHVERYGTIPRWSPWTKKLDARRAELMAAEPNTTQSLNDL